MKVPPVLIIIVIIILDRYPNTSVTPPDLFALVIVQVETPHIFAPGHPQTSNPLAYSQLWSWYDRHTPSREVHWLMMASNHDPPNLCLPSS
jgi:hypothetical protein